MIKANIRCTYSELQYRQLKGGQLGCCQLCLWRYQVCEQAVKDRNRFWEECIASALFLRSTCLRLCLQLQGVLFLKWMPWLIEGVRWRGRNCWSVRWPMKYTVLR